KKNLYYKKARPFGETIMERLAGGGAPITVAGGGNPSDGVGDGLAANQAAFANISGLAVDAAGNVLIADSGQSRIRKLAKDTLTISTVAGTGSATSSGDNGLAISAGLEHPSAIAVN